MTLPRTGAEIRLWNCIGKLIVDPGSILISLNSIEKSFEPSHCTQYEIGFLLGLLSSIFLVTRSPNVAGNSICAFGI